jgi:hypothetical protein
MGPSGRLQIMPNTMISKILNKIADHVLLTGAGSYFNSTMVRISDV